MLGEVRAADQVDADVAVEPQPAERAEPAGAFEGAERQAVAGAGDVDSEVAAGAELDAAGRDPRVGRDDAVELRC